MKFPRSIRLDQSDPNVFSPAAEPGEWAVPGSLLALEHEATADGITTRYRIIRPDRDAALTEWHRLAAWG